MQRITIISNTVGTGLIATDVITSSLSYPAFSHGWALPVGVGLSGMDMLKPLVNAASQKSSQLFTVKKKNTI